MNNKSIVKERGITRLCHFTKSANLPYILGDGFEDSNGIIPNIKIRDMKFLQVNDVNRIDQHPNLVCTSIQYPNFYFFKASQNRNKGVDDLLTDWVIILISPEIIDDETYFCPVNAATQRGRFISQGVDSFRTLFADNLEKFKGSSFVRNVNYPLYVTTDIQAEVLFAQDIPSSSIIGLIFSSQHQARTEKLRLKLCNVSLEGISFYYSEYYFDKSALNFLKTGKEIPLFKLEE